MRYGTFESIESVLDDLRKGRMVVVVDDADRELFFAGKTVGEGESVGDHRAEGPDHDIGAFAENLGVADREGDGLSLDLGAGAGTAGVADEAGTGKLEAGVEHVHEFVLVRPGRIRYRYEPGCVIPIPVCDGRRPRSRCRFERS